VTFYISALEILYLSTYLLTTDDRLSSDRLGTAL